VKVEADTGIDLVARERGTGDLVAIQCKFYAPTASLSWSGVSTFVGMLGQPEFTSGMIVSTAGSESPKVEVNLDKHAKAPRSGGSTTSSGQRSIGTSSPCRVRPSSASAHR
jgi:predicted helicase